MTFPLCPRTLKWGYPSCRTACSFAQYVLKKHHDYVEPYQCPFCRDWHLGHPKHGQAHHDLAHLSLSAMTKLFAHPPHALERTD
jgi:hypothetical protein